MEPQQPSGLEIQTRLIGRAAIDPNFREQLLTNSRAAIEKELGITLPPNLEIQVVEETPTKLCLVLPMKQETHQLSDVELKAVVGGSLPVPLPMPVAAIPDPIPQPTLSANLPGPLPTLVYSYDRLTTFKR